MDIEFGNMVQGLPPKSRNVYYLGIGVLYIIWL